MLVTSPVSWITGIAYTIVPILQGATRVLMAYTNESDLLHTIRKYKVSAGVQTPVKKKKESIKYCTLLVVGR